MDRCDLDQKYRSFTSLSESFDEEPSAASPRPRIPSISESIQAASYSSDEDFLPARPLEIRPSSPAPSQTQHRMAMRVGPSQGGGNTPTQAAVYDRYMQEKYIQPWVEVQGFKIYTTRTFLNPHSKKPKKVATIGGPPGFGRPVSSIPPAPAVPPQNNQHKNPATREPAPLTHQAHEPHLKNLRRPPNLIPIIIIPAANTSLITMYNVKDILENLKFTSTDEKKAAGAKRDNEVLLQRRKEGSQKVQYRVIDNPLQLGPEDWGHVVAVFVLGPAWQFKGWPWDGDRVQIFSNICAFHIKWDDDKLDANVGLYDVNVIPLSRNLRHRDTAALRVFWEKLDKHTQLFKRHLRH